MTSRKVSQCSEEGEYVVRHMSYLAHLGDLVNVNTFLCAQILYQGQVARPTSGVERCFSILYRGERAS